MVKRAMENDGAAVSQDIEDTSVKRGSNSKGRTRWQLSKALKLKVEVNMGSLVSLEKVLGNGAARARKDGRGPRGKLSARVITS